MRSEYDYTAATCTVELITAWYRTEEFVVNCKLPEHYR